MKSYLLKVAFVLLIIVLLALVSMEVAPYRPDSYKLSAEEFVSHDGFITMETFDELVWCKKLAPKYGNAELEYRLPDSTRVDMLNSTEAIEVDWAEKWAEGVGQALYYAELTGKKPAIILLFRKSDDKIFFLRCQVVCTKYNIKLYAEKTY